MSWQEADRQRFEAVEKKVGGLLGVLTASATWDPAATAATQGAEVSTTIAVAGAVAGDIVRVSHDQIGVLAAVLVGTVTAPGVVTVRVVNTAAVAVNVPSGTLKVAVFKT